MVLGIGGPLQTFAFQFARRGAGADQTYIARAPASPLPKVQLLTPLEIPLFTSWECSTLYLLGIFDCMEKFNSLPLGNVRFFPPWECSGLCDLNIFNSLRLGMCNSCVFENPKALRLWKVRLHTYWNVQLFVTCEFSFLYPFQRFNSSHLRNSILYLLECSTRYISCAPLRTRNVLFTARQKSRSVRHARDRRRLPPLANRRPRPRKCARALN